MSKLKLNDEIVLLLSLSKMWYEQSMYLQNELVMDDKDRFTNARNGIVSFINYFERKIKPEHRVAFNTELEGITDCLHDGMTGLRKELLDKQNQPTI